jgi:hypothetical protein
LHYCTISGAGVASLKGVIFARFEKFEAFTAGLYP